MALNFYTSVATRFILSQKIFVPNSYVCRSYRKKKSRGEPFWEPHILNSTINRGAELLILGCFNFEYLFALIHLPLLVNHFLLHVTFQYILPEIIKKTLNTNESVYYVNVNQCTYTSMNFYVVFPVLRVRLTLRKLENWQLKGEKFFFQTLALTKIVFKD